MSTKITLLKTMFRFIGLDLKYNPTMIKSATRIMYKGSKSKLEMNKMIAINPVHKYQAGKPSLYKTKIIELKIKALPGS